MNRVSYQFFSILVVTGVILVLSCSTLKDLANIQKPTVSLQRANVTDLSFEDISFIFDIGIDNPNQLSIKLAGLNYDFLLNDESFIQGTKSEEINIASQATSTVEIPVSLNFQNIYQTFKSLSTQDSTEYQLKVDLLFDLPVLGKTSIPASTSGYFPLLRLPSLSLKSLTVNRLGLTGAELSLSVALTNPNPLSLNLNKLDYSLMVNGMKWASGHENRAQTIASNSDSILRIPVILDFMQVGQSVYQLIMGQSPVDYNFSGQINLGGNNRLMKDIDFPFDKTGTLDITK